MTGDALHDGIPPWLKSSIEDWIAGVLRELCKSSSENAYLLEGHDAGEARYRGLLLRIERELRLGLCWERGVRSALESLLLRAGSNPTVCFSLLNFLLKHTYPDGAPFAQELEAVLYQGGSKWCVSAAGDSLEERVASEAAERAAQLMTMGTRAGEHLRQAWYNVYGRNPNPSHAYREAVRAVEVVTIPVVSPKNAKATLGTVIGA
jgi:hypothetical protein